MKRVLKNQILHAILWIITYVFTVNLGDYLSETMHAPYLTTLLVLLLSCILGIYILVFKIKLTSSTEKEKSNGHYRFIYLPLILIGCIQVIKGFDNAMDASTVLIITIFMICVGFIEEVIFRGFLLKGIQVKSNVKKAILVSGITFGLGHIVNLSRGYGYGELIAQIIVAIAIGVMLSLLVILTHRLLPGIIFHMVFNITGSITIENRNIEAYILLAILLIIIPFNIYLYQKIKQTQNIDPITVSTQYVENTK